MSPASACAISEDAIVDEPAGLPAGAGPVWTGGFAFDPEGARPSPGPRFAPASMVLPELSLCRSGEQTFLTVNAVVAPGDDARGGRRSAARGSPACAPTRCRCSTRTRPTARRSAASARRATSKPPSTPRQTGSAAAR